MKTAESVTPMHPDKMCDRVSDAILDACLEQDENSRAAIETMGGHGVVTVTGELTTKAYVNMREVAQSVVGEQYGVQINVVQQSPEIAGGVDTGGAGDQGIMNGYACDDNWAMIPQEVFLSRNLCQKIYEQYPHDGKTQITLDDNGLIQTVVASFQNVSRKDLDEIVEQWINGYEDKTRNDMVKHLNPAGDWSVGGFEADTGLTGRKLAVDSYGPRIPLGGGAFSGKDATKVDRSAAYMARKIAVDILTENNAHEVFVQLAYSIGVAEPVQAIVSIDGTQAEVKLNSYDLTPKGIINFLDLRKPIYSETAKWGHFGNGFIWDKI